MFFPKMLSFFTFLEHSRPVGFLKLPQISSRLSDGNVQYSLMFVERI